MYWLDHVQCFVHSALSHPSSSLGYHSDDGTVRHGHSFNARVTVSTFGEGDVVGCGINFRDSEVFPLFQQCISRQVFFTRNAEFLVAVFVPGVVKSLTNWYPTVSTDRAGDKVEFNFGQKEFLYNIANFFQDREGNSKFSFLW